jgi:hypothetical protein
LPSLKEVAPEFWILAILMFFLSVANTIIVHIMVLQANQKLPEEDKIPHFFTPSKVGNWGFFDFYRVHRGLFPRSRLRVSKYVLDIALLLSFVYGATLVVTGRIYQQ